MKSKRIALKAASFIAAATLSAAMPLSTIGSTFMQSALTAYAAETSGSLTYEKYDDHVEIVGSDYKATSIEIPASISGLPVTAIGDYAFNGSSLSSVTIPDTVKTIGKYAFAMSSNLKSVTIPESVEFIDLRAFDLCKQLSEVNLPDKMIEMSARVFDNTPWIDAQRQKNDLVIINGNLIDGEKAKGDVVIPSDVKYVSAGAFERNEDITSVVFPSSVTKINDNVFFYCSNLKSVDAKSCTFIDSMAFAYCNKLTDLKVSGKMTKIDYMAFSDVTAQATITVYGTKADWDQADKPTDDKFLNNAKYIFDESYVAPPEEIEGDLNADGSFNTADLILMNKWLLNVPGTELANWKAGDFIKDEQLDVYDLVLMRKALIAKGQ
ncbi:leucine-rich repeat protein [Ruminococcus sp.]|uniref:leucine-rich repeat protein n=1 Tax=Ruminococcus sp. TaxID=41978 RepID=UPI0025CE8DA2|nr:leucine-rich repeat protein [Ruminococcus sp.]MBQ6034069.1 leucine-rich repeat protein [Ruminococcus sp.]MBQ6250879.1 leucine-rich repeat protein [Ruminococcus sp.]